MVGRSLQAEYYREPQQKPFGEEVAVEADGLSLGNAYKTSASSCMPARSSALPASSAPAARS